MRKSLVVLVCAAAAFALVKGVTLADSPPPTEEQIEAQLKEARKRVEAAQAEEKALLERLAAAKEAPRGQIAAEVSGVLVFRAGEGYHVRVRPKDDPKREIRVSLRVAEDKVTVRLLEGFTGKDIVVKGTLLQTADGGLYMSRFEVERGPVEK